MLVQLDLLLNVEPFSAMHGMVNPGQINSALATRVELRDLELGIGGFFA